VQLKKWKDDLQENLEQFVVAELTCSRFVRGEVGVTLLTDWHMGPREVNNVLWILHLL
jgi:hypothetical protein